MKSILDVTLTKDKTAYIYLVTILLGIFIISVGSQILVKQLSLSTGIVSGIYIEDVVLTSDFDTSGESRDHSLTFDSDVSRIYCVIYIKGIFGLPMTGTILVRWYYGNEQIRSHYFPTTSKPVVLWLENSDKKPLGPGLYTLEIFINRTLIRTIEFEVK